MAAGAAVSLIAAGIQTVRSLRVRWIWEFDRNGVYHLVQTLGVLLFGLGFRADEGKQDAMTLERIAAELAQEVEGLRFGPPVAHVYNPLAYAWEPHRRYLQRYGLLPGKSCCWA